MAEFLNVIPHMVQNVFCFLAYGKCFIMWCCIRRLFLHLSTESLAIRGKVIRRFQSGNLLGSTKIAFEHFGVRMVCVYVAPQEVLVPENVAADIAHGHLGLVVVGPFVELQVGHFDQFLAHGALRSRVRLLEVHLELFYSFETVDAFRLRAFDGQLLVLQLHMAD